MLAVLSSQAAAQEAEVSPAVPCDPGAVPANVDPAECLPTQGAPARGGENAITQAADAFGFSSGKESIGLYSSSNVRGFSPVSAGNVRIDGLYFDQVFGLTNRVRESTSVRVGLSTLGRPFPAPTGIVDYQLFQPGEDGMVSALVSGNSYGTVTVESDFILPLHEDGLSMGGGFYVASQQDHDGATSIRDIQGLLLRWAPSDRFDTTIFWTRSAISDDERTPSYVPAGPFLPPPVKLHEYHGPDWAVYNSVGQTFGATTSILIGNDWELRAGMFQSRLSDPDRAVQLYRELDQQGNAQRVISVDPPSWTSSTSGEVRLSRAVSEGPRQHVISLSLWGRDRNQVYGGTDTIEFGPIAIGQDAPLPRPEFNFGEQSADAINQWTGGVSYHGQWDALGELNFGIAKSDYRKEVHIPGSPASTSTASPWIYNGSLSVQPVAGLTTFATLTRGLEESGVAPDNAVNRNEPLPAILTIQKEVGLRYGITPTLNVLAGAFELKKPYYNLNQAGRYALLGDVRNRGIELSVSGALNDRTNIIAGAVLLDPVVTGEGVRLGRLGRRPVGLARQTFMFNIDWRPPWQDGLSFDLSVSHDSKITATRNNLVSIPPRTSIDVGARYRLRLFGGDSTLRVRLTNLTGNKGFELRGAGAYTIIPGRLLTVYLASSF